MKNKGEREREREKKKSKEMSVRVLCLPRNFSVSVMRFLNWGPFLVVYKCETEDACSLCLVSCVCEGTCKGDSVCRVKNSYRQTSWVFAFFFVRASRSVLLCCR